MEEYVAQLAYLRHSHRPGTWKMVLMVTKHDKQIAEHAVDVLRKREDAGTTISIDWARKFRFSLEPVLEIEIPTVYNMMEWSIIPDTECYQISKVHVDGFNTKSSAYIPCFEAHIRAGKSADITLSLDVVVKNTEPDISFNILLAADEGMKDC